MKSRRPLSSSIKLSSNELFDTVLLLVCYANGCLMYTPSMSEALIQMLNNHIICIPACINVCSGVCSLAGTVLIIWVTWTTFLHVYVSDLGGLTGCIGEE